MKVVEVLYVSLGRARALLRAIDCECETTRLKLPEVSVALCFSGGLCTKMTPMTRVPEDPTSQQLDLNHA